MQTDFATKKGDTLYYFLSEALRLELQEERRHLLILSTLLILRISLYLFFSISFTKFSIVMHGLDQKRNLI